MGRKARQKLSKKSLKQNDVREKIIDSKPIITIIDRLNLSPYHNEDAEEDEYELQLEFKPRRYFVSSLCCLCSKICSSFDYPCEDCHMVAYCSSQHRQQHLNLHKELCVVLSDICGKKNELRLAKDLDPEDFRSFRVQLLSTIENTLGRRMDLYEREIILYPRLCRLCHDSKNLKCCNDCEMEFYCDEHRSNHANYCNEFRIFRTILEMQINHGFVTPRIPNIFFEENHVLPDNFDALIKDVFVRDYEKIDCNSYAALSQVASPPLTVFYALKNLSRRRCKNFLSSRSLKIQVVGAELQFECANLSVWEKFFLHFLPKLKNLELEFFGPELQVPDDILKLLENPKLCANCRNKNKEIKINLHRRKFYHQIESDKPDLVCLFNPGLYRITGFANQDTWPLTIKKFCKYEVPILVTSYTEIELPRDLNRIRQFSDILIEQEPQKNPFSSLRPERNFVSDDVVPLIYKNYYLSVVRGKAVI